MVKDEEHDEDVGDIVYPKKIFLKSHLSSPLVNSAAESRKRQMMKILCSRKQ